MNFRVNVLGFLVVLALWSLVVGTLFAYSQALVILAARVIFT